MSNRSRKEVFESLVERITESGCWIWNGAQSDGYGTFNYEGRLQRAHRVSWLLFCGQIPDGMLVCHTCDVKSCVNPKHLYLGTCKENVRDAFDRGLRAVGDRHWRRLNPTRQTGEEGPNASLKTADVKEIRSSRETQAELAERYGVSRMQIYRIQRRQCWRHVEE